MPPSLRIAFLAVALLALSGCGSWSNPLERVFPTHRIDIQQGNAVTQAMLDKLKPGMTPSQVRFILGTPLIVDPFRANRWDYVYRLEQGGKLRESRRITVIFESERLKSLEGDVVAAQMGARPPPSTPARGGGQ